ncbi:MAG: Mov34/MPN/PAD-1 family protein [Anaerolineae bacterium]|nr:Mov34/MPN/PAD-1 family protein [Anaerolineae bacterium]
MALPNPVHYTIYDGQGLPDLPSGKVYGYVLAGNGVFKYAATQHFAACILVGRCRVAGLPLLAPSVRLAAGRLPGALLAAILRDAREQARDAPREAMYHIKMKRNTAMVQRPPQTGEAAHLAYSGGADADIVCDLHSHCQMRAFFSGTDDRDEQGCRLYGVVGQIFTRPEFVLRVGLYGDFWPVRIGDVFEV